MSVDENQPDTHTPDAGNGDSSLGAGADSSADSRADGSGGARGPKLAAVDTGRRIDPTQLQGARPPRRDNKRRGPEIVRKDLDGNITVENGAAAADGAAATASAGGADNGEQQGTRGDGAQRADGERGPRGDRPRGDRPRGDRPRGDRPRGDRPRDGDRGTRDDRPRGPTKPRVDFKDMAPISAPHTHDAGDFASMLAQTGPIDRKNIRVGDRVTATCVHIGSETVFFQVSKTQEAHAPTAEFLDDEGTLKIKPGDRLDAFVTSLSDGMVLSTRLGKDQLDVGMLEAAREAKIPVQGTVTGVNKGGVEVQLAGAARGFCPTAQLDVNFVDDPQVFMGKTLEFLVREVRENGRNIVLTRRALVERERKEKGDKLMATLQVGQVVDGVVTRIQPFGAFVDLGGLDGLIPVFEMSFAHVKDPSDVVTLGQTVRVEVKRIEEDPKRPGQMRISLSLKSMLADPYVEHAAELHRGVVLEGQVKKLEAFGAFVELFPGVQGLVHVSEIADRRIAHPRDVLKVDETVRVTVIDFDPSTRRVSLTMKEGSQALLSDDERTMKREAQKSRVGRGAMVEGTVDRIESFGIFLKLDPVDGRELGSAMMPASETGTPRGTDLRKAFPLGTRMQAVIIEVDERGRLKVSKTAREQAEERALVAQYNSSSKQGGGGSGLGTLGDLLKAKLGK